MSKSISDRANVTAYVILSPKGEHVANVQFFFGSGGGVQCEVFNFGNAPVRCLDVAMKSGRVTAKQVEKLEAGATYCSTPESRREWAARELFSNQNGRASGYGYDKKTAALSRLMIDGHSMADHCGAVPEDEAKRARLFREYCKAHDEAGGNTDGEYWRKRANRLGCSFANWSETEAEAIAHNMRRYKVTKAEAREQVNRGGRPPRIGRYTSMYFRSGLERLSALGYRVITAV